MKAPGAFSCSEGKALSEPTSPKREELGKKATPEHNL